MVDWAALNAVLSARNGVWTLVALAMVGLWRGWAGLPAVMAQWVAWRQVKAEQQFAAEAAREAAKAADWQRLRDEVTRQGLEIKDLKSETGELRQAVRDCEAREFEWHRRAIEAEAKVVGHVEARQMGAAIVAADRADPAKATEAMKAAERLAERKNEGEGGK